MNSSISSLRRGLLLTAFALIASLAVSAAETFEGRIHMRMTAGKKDSTAIDYSMKDGKIRMDIPKDPSNREAAGMGGIIMDIPHQEMIILIESDGQKMFMRRSLAQTMTKANEQSEGTHRGAVGSPPVATGRTEMIAGYPAKEYIYTGEKGNKSELWLASGLGTFMAPMSGSPMGGRGGSAAPAGWENFARDGGGFPLRVVTRDAKGVEQARMEVTKIEKTHLPDSLFSTDGYSEFSIPGMGAGGFNPFKR
ncbi:MAG: DUF4412 domain-containing protein [Opitutaceae bacterium]